MVPFPLPNTHFVFKFGVIFAEMPKSSPYIVSPLASSLCRIGWPSRVCGVKNMIPSKSWSLSVRSMAPWFSIEPAVWGVWELVALWHFFCGGGGGTEEV